MPSLAELQTQMAQAVLGRGTELEALAALLHGGSQPRNRLAVHSRHYAASLTAALLDKFPGSVWLLGAPLVESAARAYVQAHAPDRPCIAEYGTTFPEFLATHGRAAALPYVETFARLEWLVGKASIAVTDPPMSWASFAAIGSATLLDSTLDLQSGTRYLRAGWPVDDLLRAYLGATAPERFVMEPVDACIEIRGARGELTLQRLDTATFAFRHRLLAGATIATAAETAFGVDVTFDLAAALRSLVDAKLLVRAVSQNRRPKP